MTEPINNFQEERSSVRDTGTQLEASGLNPIMRRVDSTVAMDMVAANNSDASFLCGPLEIADNQKPDKNIAGLSSQDGNLHITLPKEIQGITPQIENRANGLKVSTWGDKNKPTHELWQYKDGSEVLSQQSGNDMEIVSLLEAPAPTGTGATRDFIEIHSDGKTVTSIDVTNSSTGDKETYKAGDKDKNITELKVIPAGDGHPPGYSIQRGGKGGSGLPIISTAYVDQSGRWERIGTYTNIQTHRFATASEKSPDGESLLPVGTIVRSESVQRGNNPENLIWRGIALPKDSSGSINARFWHNVAKAGEPNKFVLSGERFKAPQALTPETLHLTGNVQPQNVSGWLMEPSPRAATRTDVPKIYLLRSVAANGDKPASLEQFAVWTLDSARTKITDQTILSKKDLDTISFPDEFP